jgi:deoxyribose-phosphate aldolase
MLQRVDGAVNIMTLLEIEDLATKQSDYSAFAEQILSNWHHTASLLDHTLLRPDAVREAVHHLCDEAAMYRFACAVVSPSWVAEAHSILHGTGVKVCSVVGFPSGAATTSTKRFEAEELVRLGAEELDMVMNIGALRSGDRARVQQDIRAVAEVTHGAGAKLKVILENGLLTLDEKILACELAIGGGADYLKTSTGFASGGATVSDVGLMRGIAGDRCGVKASGGIRTPEDVREMLAAGANRIGSSNCVAIVRALGAP